MSDANQSSLLIALPQVGAVVAEWRDRYDVDAVTRGIPAHVTVLWPFLHPAEIDATSLAAARDAIASAAPFDLVFGHVDEFPGVLWLRSEPDEPIQALTAALWKAYPQCPPYRGEFVDSQPHCTVALTTAVYQQRLRQEIARDLAPSLPITVRVDAIELWASDEHDQWTKRDALPLLG